MSHFAASRLLTRVPLARLLEHRSRSRSDSIWPATPVSTSVKLDDSPSTSVNSYRVEAVRLLLFRSFFHL